MKLVRALIIASHPIPSLAVTAMAALLTAEAAPAGFGAGRVVLVALAVLAGQLSVGWSNDAIDAERDAGRSDKPAAVGLVSVRALWLGAAVAVTASLALAAALGPVSLAIDAAMTAVAWSYNLGLKSTVWSGASYAVAFGLLPSFSASALPGHPLARWPVTAAAALLGLGAHFANVLPDLAADERNGVRGLPQRLAARSGPGATRSAALVLLLGRLGAPADRGQPGPPVGGDRRAVLLRCARRGRRPGTREGPVPGRDRHRRGQRGAVRRRRRGTDVGPASSGRARLMTQIIAVHSAFPAHRYPQADLTRTVASLAGMDAVTDEADQPGGAGGADRADRRKQRALLERLHGNAGVDTRHTVFPLTDYGTLGPAANDRYIEEATALGERALRGALAASGLDARDLDLLIVTSVTGVAVPSLDALLMPRLGLRADVKRLPVFGLGCVAGAAGLARLHDYLLGWPRHTAALLAVELCSLSLPRSSVTTADLVASALFGDGAVALVATGTRARGRAGGRVPSGGGLGRPAGPRCRG